jgi:UDP-N-acetylmuramate: L-alanyl-gamma-D-glutamyl-meso-diaminopimelate ligase
MGGIALLAREQGVEVSGSDANVYPPVIGNALSRGNPAVEQVLNAGLAYTSGPQWLAEHVLQDRWVLAVAGTHGKTSTASMLAWILEYAGLEPGFLIGGIPRNFGISARLGKAPFFVVEADEYDTAFFDKRSKFVHYRPRTLVLNNLEYDHADIFTDLAAIQRQFHHLVRTVPGTGLIVENADDTHIAEVLAMGCWSGREAVSIRGHEAGWQAGPRTADASQFDVLLDGQVAGRVRWGQHGEHNVHNALAAIAAARHAGVPVVQAIAALGEFQGIKRRMELRGEVNGVTVYDDFAHHPTAIATTLQGLRQRVGEARILLVLEPRSNTMRMGVHRDALAASMHGADRIWLHEPGDLEWSLEEVARETGVPASVSQSVGTIVDEVVGEARPGDHVLVMSNGGFEGIHERLLRGLEALAAGA